jgi:hypothetical protein
MDKGGTADSSKAPPSESPVSLVFEASPGVLPTSQEIPELLTHELDTLKS